MFCVRTILKKGPALILWWSHAGSAPLYKGVQTHDSNGVDHVIARNLGVRTWAIGAVPEPESIIAKGAEEFPLSDDIWAPKRSYTLCSTDYD
jgi:hypothetical protein